jgi:hypothetical protein
MSSEPVRLEPFELGQLFDRSLKLYRRNLRLLFALSGLALAVTYIVIKPQVVQLWQLLRQGAGLRLGAADIGLAAGLWWPLLRNGLALVISAVVMSSLAEGLIVEAAGPLYLGERPTVGQCLRRFLPKAPRLILTRLLALTVFGLIAILGFLAMRQVAIYLLQYLLTVGSKSPQAEFIAAAIVSLVAGLPMISLILWLNLCWVLLPEAVVLEGRGYLDALRRSAHMIRLRDPQTRPKRHLMRAVILLTAYTAIYASIDGVIGAVYFLAGIFFGYRGVHDLTSLLYSPAYVPPAVAVPLEMLMTFCDAALLPLVWLAMLVLYYDIRVRHEGYDLERIAESMAAAAPPEKP